MSAFVIPYGKKAGCLPRSTRVGEACPLFGEKIPVMTESEVREAISARKAAGIKTRQFVKDVLDQDGVGSCATESTTQGVRTRKIMSGRPCPILNPWFLYYHSSGGRDQGSSIDENLKLAREIGIPSMEAWPRSKGWQTKPSNEAYLDALNNRITEFYDITTTMEIRTALVLDFLVVFGHDSHSELMIDIPDYAGADVVNSWGDWEDGGFHAKPFPFSRVNFAYGCWAVRVVE